MDESGIVRINLFEKLEITMEGVTLGEAEMRSQQLVRLFSLLVRNHRTGCSAQALGEGLWGDEVRDTTNALKNLIYRLRKLVENTWGRRDFIVTGKGLYQLDPRTRLEVDTERFEALLARAERAGDEERRIRHLEEAIGLYRGRYLAAHEEDPSILFLQNYYRDRYLDAVQVLADLYESRERYADIEELCERALIIEPREGLLHCILLRAYIKNLRLSKAEQQYRETMHVMGDHLSSERLKELRDLYEEMMKQQHDAEMDLDSILSELSEDKQGDEAFYCEYGVFRRIYELESRERERKGYPITLALLSLSAADAALENDGMERLLEVLLSRLRHGDIITKYSNTQYLVMLPECPEASADIALIRISERYDDLSPLESARLSYSYREMQ
ncbi:MAG: winged helix-turn-helix domain-containing protein [Firmicutes bacterium]|nr:winged helix-turn-helix domain-containing protein [Bacillota bacterium]